MKFMYNIRTKEIRRWRRLRMKPEDMNISWFLTNGGTVEFMSNLHDKSFMDLYRFTHNGNERGKQEQIMLAEYIKRSFNAHNDLKKALKKAINDYGREGGPWNVPSEPEKWLMMARAAIAKAEAE